MANTYKALSTVTVGAGGASSISFTNIPQTYTDLVLKFSTRDGRTGISVSDIRFNFNGTGVGTNISGRYLYGNGTSATSVTISSSGELAFGTAAGATASTFGNAEVYIPNYIAGVNKSVSSDSVAETNATIGYQLLLAGLWSNTAPITSIEMTPFTSPFAQYSTATLYGVFNADVSSAPATPTIGTATAGDTSASITFTGVSNAASYTMTSTPSSITGTGTTSPITVSGLTNGTAYTFTVKSNNPFGSSAESAASNSVTPILPSSYESIATTVLSTSANEITFSSIPSTYRHLELRYTGKTTAADGVSDVFLRMNGNSGAVYSNLMNGLYNSSTEKLRQVNTSTSSMGYVGGNTSTNALVSSGIINVANYTNTSYNKTYYFRTGVDGSGSTNMNRWAAWGGGIAEITAAINSLTLKCADFAAGTRVDLYGIKG